PLLRIELVDRWIPAFAGMTSFLASFAFPPCSLPRQILGDADEGVGIADDDALAAALDDAVLLPAAHDAADGMERRRRHLGDVLAGDRKADGDPGVGALPGLL